MDNILKSYSKETIDLFLQKKNYGVIKNAEGYGEFTGPCGNSMEIYLKIKNDKICDAKFETDGSEATVICGSIVTSLSIGRKIQDVMTITSQDILNKLGGLPKKNEHCSFLAENTLKQALRNYLGMMY